MIHLQSCLCLISNKIYFQISLHCIRYLGSNNRTVDRQINRCGELLIMSEALSVPVPSFFCVEGNELFTHDCGSSPFGGIPGLFSD